MSDAKYLTLLQKAVPHCIIKDSGEREQVRKELDLEFRTNVGHLLRHHERLQMVLASDEQGAVQCWFDATANEESSDFLVQDPFRFWSFERIETPPERNRETPTLKICRLVHFAPVGDIHRYLGSGAAGATYEERNPPLLPIGPLPPDKRAYRITLPRKINIKQQNFRWRHLAERLALRPFSWLSIKVQAAPLKPHHIVYVGKCLGENAAVPTGRLVGRQLATEAYLSIMTSGQAYQMDIRVGGEDAAGLYQAFLRDTDPDAFTEAPKIFTEAEERDLQSSPEELVKYVRLQPKIYGVDEALSLLCPPYTFDDALAGFEHFQPTPFVMPSVESRAKRKEPATLEQVLSTKEMHALAKKDGNIVLLGTTVTKQQVVLRQNSRDRELTRSLFVTGSAGSGKTNTVISILRQVDAPKLIIDPVGYEYSEVAEKIGIEAKNIISFVPDKWIQFNPFVVPPTASIYSHARLLGQVFSMMFPNATAIGKATIDAVVLDTYLRAIAGAAKQKGIQESLATPENLLRRNGAWLRSLKSDPEFQDGAIPLFENFVKVCRTYIPESATGRSALETREWLLRQTDVLQRSLLSLVLSPKTRSRDCFHYFRTNTLIQLGDVVNETERNFLFVLLVALNYSYHTSSAVADAAAQSGAEARKLRHFSVLEELHRIAPRDSGGVGESGQTQSTYEAAKLVQQMLAEQRKFGLATCLVDQSFSKIIPDVMINCGTQIIHRCTYGEDKDAIEKAMGLTARESASLSFLKPGEALVSTPGLYQPVYVNVPKAY